MTFDERVRALEPFRFTPRQARFLVTVALHGGYCLRRQYTAFAGVQYGRVVREFLDGLVTRRLAARESCRGDRGYLYHVYARSIYHALQQDDNRNRRHTSLAAIGRKLMLLDVVIGSPASVVRDRVDKSRSSPSASVPAADLPQRSYGLRRAETSTTRYFMQSCRSIWRAAAGAFVTLALEATGRAFEQFLRDHARVTCGGPWSWWSLGASGRRPASRLRRFMTGRSSSGRPG
jgi:hypothetical protein